MDDDDFRAIITVLEQEFRDSDAAGIADERHYTERDPETGDAQLLPPGPRAVELLRSFGRFLAIQDRATGERALATIAEYVDGEPPQRAVVELASDGDQRFVDLGDAPDLAAIRKDVEQLVRRLGGKDRYGDGEFA